jgi:hypothetical protein
MPDQKISTSPKTTPAPVGKPLAPTLAPASESGDPAVHKLLADLETARSNGDADAVKAAQAALAELGFAA